MDRPERGRVQELTLFPLRPSFLLGAWRWNKYIIYWLPNVVPEPGLAFILLELPAFLSPRNPTSWLPE